jgi:excinuclease UvrABC nuclease subunit
MSSPPNTIPHKWSPVTALPIELESIPDFPAVFMLWAEEGKPYLAHTSLLRRRLKRLISERDRATRVLNLRGIVSRIEYWHTGSQLEASLIHLHLAQKHFPDDWQRITRLRPPVFLRLTTHNPFPRTLITTKFGKGLFFGPFASRATAEHFEGGVLDLFQIRRCEETLAPSPEHPGCIYGEMNRCLRPCQQAVSAQEYSGEVARVEQFLRTHGDSLIESAEAARDRASKEMQFEEAERMHQRVTHIGEVQARAGDLARSLDELNGVAITPSAQYEAVELWFMLGGSWQEPMRLPLAEGSGQSLDHRLREMIGQVPPPGSPNPEHLSILLRWQGSSWRDGEWLGFPSFEKIPYRKLVNAIGRVHASMK